MLKWDNEMGIRAPQSMLQENFFRTRIARTRDNHYPKKNKLIFASSLLNKDLCRIGWKDMFLSQKRTSQN